MFVSAHIEAIAFACGMQRWFARWSPDRSGPDRIGPGWRQQSTVLRIMVASSLSTFQSDIGLDVRDERYRYMRYTRQRKQCRRIDWMTG